MADLPEPISREEQYLDYIAKNLSGGGGGGGDVTYPITIDKGGTSATSAENARTNLDVYSKGEVDTAVSLKANASDVYTTTQIDEKLGEKANTSDVYSKSDIDLKLEEKVNKNDDNVIIGRDAVSEVESGTNVVIGQRTRTGADVSLATAVGANAGVSGNSGTSIGSQANTYGQNGVSIGNGSSSSGVEGISILGNDMSANGGISIGASSSVNTDNSVALGYGATVNSANNSVAIGNLSEATEENTVSVGNTTTKRRIVNVDTPVNDNDVATKAYVDSSSGGGGVNVVQTTGESETDVMSQKAVTDELNNKVNKNDDDIIIGNGASTELSEGGNISIGKNSISNDSSSICIGEESISRYKGISLGKNIKIPEETESYVSIGNDSNCSANFSVALGNNSRVYDPFTVSVGNDTLKRRIINVDTPKNDNDVATKKYVDTSGSAVFTDSVMYYVDNKNGSDSNDGSSESKAFATLDYAISKLPKIINGFVDIYLVGDATNDDYVLTNGLMNYSGSGSLSIYGIKKGEGNPILQAFNIRGNSLCQINIGGVQFRNRIGRQIYVSYNTGIISFNSVEFYRDTGQGQYPNIENCMFLSLSGCTLSLGASLAPRFTNIYITNLKAGDYRIINIVTGTTARVLSDVTNMKFKTYSGGIMFDKSGQLVTQIGE